MSFTQVPTAAEMGVVWAPTVSVAGATSNVGTLESYRVVLSIQNTNATLVGQSVPPAANGTATFPMFEFTSALPPGDYYLVATMYSYQQVLDSVTSPLVHIVQPGSDLSGIMSSVDLSGNVVDLSMGADLSVPNIDVLKTGFIDCQIGSSPRITADVSTYTRNPSSTENIVVDGGCTTQTRIGNAGTLVDNNIGTASCTGPGGALTCTYTGGFCLANGTTSFASPGDTVTIAWSGGDAGSSSTTLVPGASMGTSALPSTVPRTSDLSVPITGGGAALFTMTQSSGDFYINTKCRAAAGASTVVVPATTLARFQAGNALAQVSNESYALVMSGGYAISVQLDGDVTGPLAASVNVTLQ